MKRTTKKSYKKPAGMAGSLSILALSLILAGVPDAALALTLGVLVGTYSSIFVASPIVVEWEARSPKRFK